MVTVRVERVTMEYRLVRERNRTLKEAAVRLLRGQRDEVEQFRALDGISFEVSSGEALGIIGHNGSGKTTLLRLLAGVLDPTSGRIQVDGRTTTLIDLGAGFNPDLSGEENVYLSGALYGFSRVEMRRRLPDIVRFAEVEEFIQAPLKSYSSGMSARLGFALATDIDPDILIVDEVLAVGDHSFQEKCLERMHRFRSEGKTIVLVSHDLGTVAKFCNRAILMNHGQLIASGKPGPVISRYVNALPPA